MGWSVKQKLYLRGGLQCIKRLFVVRSHKQSEGVCSEPTTNIAVGQRRVRYQPNALALANGLIVRLAPITQSRFAYWVREGNTYRTAIRTDFIEYICTAY